MMSGHLGLVTDHCLEIGAWVPEFKSNLGLDSVFFNPVNQGGSGDT